MAQLIFKRGPLANLNNLAVKDGQFIVTTDEGALYVDNGSTRVRLGDFIVVENVAALPSTGANRKAMYYCESENVLARWNGTEWKQINKQPTTAELKVALGLDAEGEVTAAIKAAKNAADAARLDVDNLEKYVGTIPNGEDGKPMSDSVVAYINKKTEGIATSGNLEALGNRVGTVEGKVSTIEGDYLKKADKTELEGKITAVETAVSTEQSRAEGIEAGLRTDVDAIKGDYLKAADKTALQDSIDAVDDKVDGVIADYLKAADKTELEGKIATDVAAAVKTETDNRVAADEAIEAKIGTVADGKTVVKMIEEAQAAATYDDTALAGRVSAVEGDVATIKGDYLKGSDKTELQNSINEVAGDVADVVADYLKGADKTALQNAIDGKVAQSDYDTKMGEIDQTTAGLQTQINTIMNNPDAEGAINSINEFTQYVAEHGTIADGFRADIDKNKEDIAKEVKRAGDAESTLSGRLDILEAIDHDAYVAADTALKNELNGEIAKKADSSALTAAVETLEAADTGLGNRITALEGKFTGEGSVEGQIAAAKQEAIATAAGDATSKANAAESAAKTYADGLNSTMSARVDALEAIDHDHANKEELDLIASGDKAKWDAAEAKAHEHANSAELAKIADGDVAKWNGAQAAAEATAAVALASAKTELEGKIAAAETAAKGHADTEVGKVQSALETHTNKGDIHVTSADKEKWNAAETNAKSYSDEKLAEALQWGEF